MKRGKTKQLTKSTTRTHTKNKQKTTPPPKKKKTKKTTTTMRQKNDKNETKYYTTINCFKDPFKGQVRREADYVVRKTVPQRNNIHKKRIAMIVSGGKWLLEGAGVEVAKVGGQVGGEGGVRNQRFTGEDAPGHAEFLVFPSLPQQGPAELALKHIPVLSPPPSCQSGCEVLDPLQLQKNDKEKRRGPRIEP